MTTKGRKRSPKKPDQTVEVDDFKSIEAYVDSTVTYSELTTQKFSRKPGEAYWARTQSWVWICADKKASMCAAARLRLYRNGKGKKLEKRAQKSLAAAYTKSMYATDDAQEVDNHRAINLLAKPNDFESGLQFNYLRHMANQTCGNAWNYYTDDQLLTLRPMYVSHVADDSDQILKGWMYGRERTREIFIPLDESMQFSHRPSLDNPFYGVPPLVGCIADADLLNLATVAEVSRWKNEGRPPMAIKLPDTMTKEARIQAIKDFDRQVRGVKNTGRPLVMQFAEIKPMGFAPKEMEYLTGQQISKERIWAAYGIPKSVLDPNEGSLAAAKTGMAMYTEYTIWPMLCNDADQLTANFRRFGLIDETMFFCYDSPTNEDEAAEIDASRKLTDGGLMTIDEYRSEEGREPLPDGAGAVARFNGIPLIIQAAPVDATSNDPNAAAPAVDQAAKSAEPLNGAQMAALGGYLSQVGLGEIPIDSAIAAVRASIPTLTDQDISAIFNPLRNFVPASVTAAAEAVQTTAPEPVKSMEPERTKAADNPNPDLQARFEEEVAKWLRGIGKSVADGIVSITNEQVAELRLIVSRYMEEAWTDAAKAQAVSLGEAFTLAPEAAIQAVQQPVSLIIEQVTGTTQEMIREAVKVGLEEGQSYGEIAKNLEEGGLSPQRAAVIARTETANATAIGARDFAINEAGCDQKSWLLGGDPCEICVGIYSKCQAAGGWLPANEPYIIAGEMGNPEAVDRHPAHPNCACDEIYRIKPEDA